MRRMGHYRWFSLWMKHVGTPVDRGLIRMSRGRLSMSGPEMATMLLTTTGRRTGKERTIPLHYVRDGKNLVAVCENFGLDVASSWPYNLLADPTARIEIAGTAANYLSRPATEEEAVRNMPRLIDMWPAHDTYVKRSGTAKSSSSSRWTRTPERLGRRLLERHRTHTRTVARAIDTTGRQPPARNLIHDSYPQPRFIHR
jgi:deazaflavin-dependent oxidoreductase (nitroreductase family)